MTAADLHPAEAAYYAAIRAGATWYTAAEAAMKHLVDAGEPFTADDLRELLAEAGEPPTPNAYGGLFLSWSRQGLISKVGGGPSRGVKRNGGYRARWVAATAPFS